MALQHRIRRIAIGVGLMLFAICALVPGMYLMALLIFAPGLYLMLSGLLDEFPDNEPEKKVRPKPFYAQFWFLLLATLIVVACLSAVALSRMPDDRSDEYVVRESPIAEMKDPKMWISQP